MKPVEIADEFQPGRIHVFRRNAFRQTCGSLLGIAQGLLADRRLNDAEIGYLDDWLARHADTLDAGLGRVLHKRVLAVLADGVITEPEREYLVDTLERLVGRSVDSDTDDGSWPLVTELAYDERAALEFTGRVFCLTGAFVYAPREACADEVMKRGGLVSSGVSKKVHYVVVGSLGSPEWKHGSWGTKIDKAVALRESGVPIAVVREDAWAAAL